MATNFVDILKLPVDESNCRLKTEWEENGFKITLFVETLKAYHADITQEFLKKLAEERAQNVIDYYQNIKKYLMCPDAGISFDIQDHSNSTNVEFVIKRRTGGRTILLFSTTLCQINFYENVFTIIDDLLEENRSLSKRLEVSKVQQAELEKEKQLSQEKLVKFVDIKARWEQEMYSNFLIILNEKKKRIKFLTDILLKLKNVSTDKLEELHAAGDVMASELPPSPMKREAISDSSSEYETDRECNNRTDDEDFEPRASTSKQTLQMDEEQLPLLCLPKISKKTKENQLPHKIKQHQNLTATILNKNSQATQGALTQEPYLTTQERIDRII